MKMAAGDGGRSNVYIEINVKEEIMAKYSKWRRNERRATVVVWYAGGGAYVGGAMK